LHQLPAGPHIDEQGVPSNVHVDNASDPESTDEVLALIREWRFLASLRNGAPVASRGTLDFERGDAGAPRPRAKRM
jgi:hypothetical protein